MAVGRGIRAALVTFTGFALGLWVFHNLEIAVFSGFAGIAITGIADFRGRRPFRVAAVAASALLGAVLVTLGTVMGTRPVWSQTVVIFFVVAAVAFGRVMGGYALAGADAVTLFYLVASGSPASTGALPSRLAGVALGGALAVLVAVLPDDRVTPPELGRVLSQQVSEAADRLRRLSQFDPTSLPGSDAEDHATTMRIRQLIDQRPDRPTGPIPSQRAALYLVNDLERLDGLLTRLESADGPLTPTQQSTVGRLSIRVADSARSLGDPTGRGADPALPIEEGFGLLARLSLVTRSVLVHASSFGRSQDARRGWWDTGGIGEFVTHAGRRFRANLNPHSVRLQDSVRLGLGLTVAVLAIHLLDLQHGFWVALATLSVVKSDARRTGRSLAEAVVGTAVGFGITAIVIAAIGSRPGWLAAALPLTLFAAFYAKGTLSFLVGQAAFTMAVLVMFNLLAPFGWSLGVVRLEDVAAGALIGLAVGVLAWPRGADTSIGWITSRLVETSSRYLVESIDALEAADRGAEPSGPVVVSGPTPGGDPQPALDASVLADDVLAEFLDEHAGRRGARRWAEVISFGNRVRYAGEVIVSQRARTALGHEAVQRARAAAGLLEETCVHLAATLREPSGGTRPDRPVGAPFDTDPDDELALWIQDLAASACALLAPGTTERRSP